MSESTVATVIAFVIFFGFVAFALLRTRSAAWQERQLRALANRAGLIVPPALEPALLRVVVRRQRAWTWAWAGVYSVGFLTLGVGSGWSSSPLPFLLLPLSMLVAGAAAVIVVMVDPRRAALGNPVARLQTVRVTDLVPRPVIIVVCAVVALTAAVAVIRLVLGAGAPAPAGDLVSFVAPPLALLAVPLLGLWWLASGRIARSRPLAGDGATLAWSDALRAESVRDLLIVPVTAALPAIPFLVSDIVRLLDPSIEATSVGSGVAFLATIAILIALVVLMYDHRTTRHFHRALWPAPPAEPATIAS